MPRHCGLVSLAELRYEAPDCGGIHGPLGTTTLFERRPDNKTIGHGQAIQQVVRRHPAANNHRRAARCLLDFAQTLQRYRSPGGYSRYNQRIGVSTLHRVEDLIVQGARRERTRMFDLDVGPNLHVVGSPRTPIRNNWWACP